MEEVFIETERQATQVTQLGGYIWRLCVVGTVVDVCCEVFRGGKHCSPEAVRWRFQKAAGKCQWRLERVLCTVRAAVDFTKHGFSGFATAQLRLGN